MVRLLLLCAALGHAAPWRTAKKIDPAALQRELQAAGFMVTDITCRSAEDCEINMAPGETKDPAGVIDGHDSGKERRARLKDERRLRELAAKLRDGSASPEQRDELLLLLVAMLLPRTP